VSISGYIEDYSDYDTRYPLALYRGTVARAINGKRGQAFFRDLLDALDAMPVKRLIANDLIQEDGAVCAIGALGAQRGVDMKAIDPNDLDAVAAQFNIAHQLAQEVVFMNDEMWTLAPETPEQRWVRMREWVASMVKEAGK
jgi:hypothetical protein